MEVRRIVIYIDLVFAYNFCMDFIVLLLSLRFQKRKASALRIMTASLVGAVWACFVELFLYACPPAAFLGTYGVVPVLMSYICVGQRTFLRFLPVLFAVSVLLGGIAGTLYLYSGVGYVLRTVMTSGGAEIVCLCIAILFAVVLGKSLYRFVQIQKELFDVRLYIYEDEVLVLKGYRDTGNLLTDPLYHKPVHIVEKDVLTKYLKEILVEEPQQFRLHYIPFHSVGRQDGVMPVIVLHRLEIAEAEKELMFTDVCIGISETKLSTLHHFQMLLNSRIMEDLC